MNMMKLLLVGIVTALISAPALAAAKKNCADARDIGKCLDQQSSPAAVRQVQIEEHQALCNQNAKNQGLQGNERSRYLSTCLHENEADKAAKASAAGKPMPADTKQVTSHKSRTRQASHTRKASKHDSRSIRRTCIRQANKQHLKGKKRSHYLRRCYKG